MLLPALLLWAMLPGAGLALCFGDDGHVAIAPAAVAAGGCPCATHVPPADAPPHGPCDDVELQKLDATAGDATSMDPAPHVAPPPPPPRCVALARPPATPPARAALDASRSPPLHRAPLVLRL
jgi:hypothetical protein